LRSLGRILIVGVAALAAVVPASAATSYSGSWPVTVTHSQHSNGTFCLTLTDNGQNGFPHSGSASLVIGSHKYPYGTFQLINHLMVATIQAQGYSQNAGLVFVAPASRGTIGQGTYDEVYGGEAFDSGALAFGAKGGC